MNSIFDEYIEYFIALTGASEIYLPEEQTEASPTDKESDDFKIDTTKYPRSLPYSKIVKYEKK